MPRFDIKEWAKTPDGIDHIQHQKPFVIGGQIWQGFQGNAIKAPESSLLTQEINDAPDIDQTKGDIWFRRKQRLEGRLQRKMTEYDKRRSQLRRERSEIREAIKEDKELGIPTSSDDLEQIARINKRMERLKDLNKELDLEAAMVGEQEVAAEAAIDAEEAKQPEPVEVCPVCEKASPPGHHDPKKWLRAHNMGAHNNPHKKEQVA